MGAWKGSGRDGRGRALAKRSYRCENLTSYCFVFSLRNKSAAERVGKFEQSCGGGSRIRDGSVKHAVPRRVVCRNRGHRFSHKALFRVVVVARHRGRLVPDYRPHDLKRSPRVGREGYERMPNRMEGRMAHPASASLNLDRHLNPRLLEDPGDMARYALRPSLVES